MKKFSINQKERRFLVIWIGACLFAFFVNFAGISGKISGTMGKNQFLLSYSALDGSYEDRFWPFTEFITDNSALYPDGAYPLFFNGTYTRFNGIFNSFNAPEFFGYLVLGLAIVFIPKMW